MVKRLFQRFGIDYSQWAALTKVLLKKDFRESSMSTGLSHGRSSGRVFYSMLLFLSPDWSDFRADRFPEGPL